MLRDREDIAMAASCRPARLEDLQRADALVALSINDLTERHGFGPMASPRPPRFQQFCLEDDPDGLWVAEDEGQIVGFGFSWVCDDLWFLAQLFVSPSRLHCTPARAMPRVVNASSSAAFPAIPSIPMRIGTGIEDRAGEGVIYALRPC
jgi:hypothetical protein